MPSSFRTKTNELNLISCKYKRIEKITCDAFYRGLIPNRAHADISSEVQLWLNSETHELNKKKSFN